MSGMHNDEANCLLTRKRPDCHHQYAYKALSTGSSMYAWIPVLLTRVLHLCHSSMFVAESSGERDLKTRMKPYSSPRSQEAREVEVCNCHHGTTTSSIQIGFL